MVEDFHARLDSVLERIAAAAGRAGREPGDIRLMAVTKGFPREMVETALSAGIILLGENRVQEAERKYLDLDGDWELHLIGHLQRNKARAASGLFHCVQSIDRLETAIALDRTCGERGRTLEVHLELNTSGEPTKAGFRGEEDLLECLDGMAALPHLRVRGLMTVGPLSDNPERIRASFSALRALFNRIRSAWGLPCFDTLSMGMSGDFEIAIEEGATLIRLGTALFGPRTAA